MRVNSLPIEQATLKLKQAVLMADVGNRFKVILGNAATNAVKSTQREGSTVRASVTSSDASASATFTGPGAKTALSRTTNAVGPLAEAEMEAVRREIKGRLQ